MPQRSKPTKFFVHRGKRWNARQSNIKQRFCSSTHQVLFSLKISKIQFSNIRFACYSLFRHFIEVTLIVKLYEVENV